MIVRSPSHTVFFSGDTGLTPEDREIGARFGPFLPVHWGTFSLALHAWDQPAETLLELAPRRSLGRSERACTANRN